MTGHAQGACRGMRRTVFDNDFDFNNQVVTYILDTP